MHLISIHTETPSFLIINDETDDQLDRVAKQLFAPPVWVFATTMHFVHAFVICSFAFFVKTYHFFTPKNHSRQFHDLYLDISLVYAHFALESLAKAVTSIFINFRGAKFRKTIYRDIEKTTEKIYHSAVLKRIRTSHIDGHKKQPAQVNIAELLKFGMIKASNYAYDWLASFRLLNMVGIR